MSDDITDCQRLLFIARSDSGSFRGEILGQREKVASQLSELLPRLTFTDEGAGTFKRGEAELTVQLVGDPVSAIEMTLRPEHMDAFRPPLERVATRTGWQILDADRSVVIFPPPAAAPAAPSGGSTAMRWAFVALLAIGGVAGGAWWTFVGSTEYMLVPSPSRMGGSGVSAARGSMPSPDAPGGVPELTGFPEGVPRSVEEFAAQAQQIGEVIARQRRLAPEFRGSRVVNEMMMVDSAEIQFQASLGNGNYVDPALLADASKVPPGFGFQPLPPQFATPSRGGYRFSFTGQNESKTFADEYSPAYTRYVYLASPEPGTPSQYAFALLSHTGKIHYTTDGRIPTEADPAVTDKVAADAPELVKEVGPERTDDDIATKLKALINRFLGSKTVQDSQLAYHEDRAIKDLRVFAAAQQAFLATLNGVGYGSPQVLSDPSLLPGRPPIQSFVDRSFTQDVREGYQFSFIGQNPTTDGPGNARLYRDYLYVAVPVGNGPATRRSFAIASDGVIRFRTDGAAPQKSDQILGSGK
jgi:hypothetical protein